MKKKFTRLIQYLIVITQLSCTIWWQRRALLLLMASAGSGRALAADVVAVGAVRRLRRRVGAGAGAGQLHRHGGRRRAGAAHRRRPRRRAAHPPPPEVRKMATRTAAKKVTCLMVDRSIDYELSVSVYIYLLVSELWTINELWTIWIYTCCYLNKICSAFFVVFFSSCACIYIHARRCTGTWMHDRACLIWKWERRNWIVVWLSLAADHSLGCWTNTPQDATNSANLLLLQSEKKQQGN